MEFSAKSKLLIVDDSAFMRKLIRDFFEGNSSIEVIGVARNGYDAIQKIQELKPDVVTMDVEMPELNGLEALKKVMEISPVPVVMLSSATKSGAESTLAAMEYGAVDFVTKPGGNISLDLHKVKEELVRKVESAAHVSISKLKKSTCSSTEQKGKTNITIREVPPSSHVSRKQQSFKNSVVPVSNNRKEWSNTSKKIVLIGTSTGGPRALQEVITKLPATIQAPILIVQHMPAGFTKSLANRLNQLSSMEVKEAEQGDVLQNGIAYIAPGGFHMKLQKKGNTYEIFLDQTEPPRSGHRPSVDVMFENISHYHDFDKIAVIMTGMGYDGSTGLVALKERGSVMAIAESQETCIVYGMPKAAIETNLVDEVIEVNAIATTIMKYLP